MANDTKTGALADTPDSAGTWSDYWQNEGAGGEVFVDGAGNKHPALAAFWKDLFADLADNTRVIDIASGAGSIFEAVGNTKRLALCAVDVAPEALEILSSRNPGVETKVSSAANVPYEDQVFDRVVSQFGIEYAGREAFAEASRLLAPGGNLFALCHYNDGYIDKRNRARLTGARIARDCEFVRKAIDLVVATERDNEKSAQQAFAPAEKALAEAIRENPDGIHTHLYFGFRQLYLERANYYPKDIIEWLRQVDAEIEKSISRISKIREVALSREDADDIAKLITENGLSDVSFEPFRTPGKDDPIAWLLTATRQAR